LVVEDHHNRIEVTR